VQRLLQQFRWTIVGVGIGIAMVTIAAMTQVDLVLVNLEWLERLEQAQVDGIATAVLLAGGGWALDAARARRQRARERETERLQVLHATMRTVHDIVNNFLNNLQLVQIEGDGLLPDEVLGLLDERIRDVAEKLRILGNLERVATLTMPTGLGIDYGQDVRDAIAGCPPTGAEERPR